MKLDPSCSEIQQELKKLVWEFRTSTDLPLRTTLDICEIRTVNDEPIRTRQYPLPHSQHETVKDELESMLAIGVVERVSSLYSLPIYGPSRDKSTIQK